ncbi:TonB-dependent receptor [Niabella pedocola]|uniref:TonB-dependent receptor n=1 Tax=Niabella pedocola TaxID=1752077 RepID=A0ABS8PT84_9BACT|nr:TonB-dependent receptor [Niabella pedocola]MCD2423488.1 TonB-dependent receptor [Niabella pedocola]
MFLTLIGMWNAELSIGQTSRTVTGTVVNQNGTPIPGVTVLIKGSVTGTVTNQTGHFTLNVPEKAGATLEFSSAGYKAQEKIIGDNATVEIVMTAETMGLDEVVVIGYGTARRKDLTGAVASVQTKKLEKEAPRSIQDLLRGNAAGLIIGQGNTAKADATLLIRGKGTLKAGNSPLNVVDGVIYDGTFADLNPNDIQSIDILKDASATAVYGAKAANGVVLITTKKGVSGKPRITFNANVGFVENAGMPRVMNGEEFITWRHDYEVGRRTTAYLDQYPQMFEDPRTLTNINTLDWYNYDQKTPVTSVTDEQLLRSWLSRLELKAPEIDNYINNKITNWQDLVFQRGFQQDYTAAASNKNDNSSYYFSLNYVNREGIVVGNRFTNFRTRLNLESKVASFLKVGANTNFAVRDEGFLQADWAQSAVISPYGSNNLDDPNSIYRRLPTGDATPVNPFHDNLYRDRKDAYNTLNSSLYGVLTLPFGFEFQSNFTPSFTWREYYNHESSKNPEWKSKGGSSERTFEKTYNWQIDNVLRWKKQFDIHSFEVTLLQNAEKGQYWRTKATASSYTPSDILGYHRLQAGSVPLNESDDTYRTGDALMGRLFYSLKDKYMLTASVRRDGYSAFGAQNPRATFPALALAWDFSEEQFMKSTGSWLDYAKLRLSWGRNGNRDIGQYDALSDMTSGLHPYIDQNGTVYVASQLYVNRMANLGLKWENKASYNIGLDFSVLKSRLSGSIDVYTATTNDLLVDRALPEIIGFNSVAANLGQLNNKGFEFSLNGIIIQKKDFDWNSSFIFMLNRSKIVRLYGDMIDIKDANGNVIGQKEADDIKNQWFIGQDPDRIWSYERVGVWQVDEEAIAKKYGNQPGDFKYKDQNGDSVMTNADKIFQGYINPRYRWTWRNEFNYKRLTLSLFIYSNWGQMDTYNRAANNNSFPDRATDYVQPRWTPENPINDFGRIGSKNIGSNYVDRSFIRLDNVALSYSMPQSFLSRIKAQRASISASVRNAAYWAPHWTFGDPESGGQPTPRTYNLSLNLTL